MRTTLRIDDQLLAEAKKWAAQTNRTLTAVIEDALREALGKRQVAAKRGHVLLTTVGGNGLREGVDIDHSAELLDLMAGADDSG